MKRGLSFALGAVILLFPAGPAAAEGKPPDAAAQDKVVADVDKAIADLNAAFVALGQWCEGALMWRHAQATYEAALGCEPLDKASLDLASDRAEQNHKKVTTMPDVNQFAVCAQKAEMLRKTYSKRLRDLAQKATALEMSGAAERATKVAAALDPHAGTGDPAFCEKYKALVAERAAAYYGVAASCEANKLWAEAITVLEFVDRQCPQRWEVGAEIEILEKRKALVNSRPSEQQVATFGKQMAGVRAGFQKKFDELARWAEGKALTQEAEQARAARDEAP